MNRSFVVSLIVFNHETIHKKINIKNLLEVFVLSHFGYQFIFRLIIRLNGYEVVDTNGLIMSVWVSKYFNSGIGFGLASLYLVKIILI